jgi:hypothetical protein
MCMAWSGGGGSRVERDGGGGGDRHKSGGVESGDEETDMDFRVLG